ncbi:TonB-dependent hemoglobin/transferrin/lactoferrin family receptor [Aureimonas populi]|uniref:TonB-dependent hemoglobin/transferrin/lactoferrin family receptor n=1 Tax=Aureimonas populi TaxID=1701758 RepID=A0ABW5CLB2_9HYPH|nr:TonB-dependent hemoglobin/transferrin/lactoferrin family receptor [Aureimonas populi]
MRPIRGLMASAAVCALLAEPVAAQTAAEEDAVALQPVIVQSGEAGAADAGGTATTSTTTRETIDNRLIDSIQDLGRTEEAGVSFNRNTRSVNIRGLEGARVLTTIDGIRVPYLADATRGATGGADSFDFNTLSALDLTRGSDPMLGSGALGGVLALRTLDPEDLLLGGRRIGVLTKSGYDSADESWFTANAVAMRAGDTYMLLQGGYRGGSETGSQGDLGGIGSTRTEPNPLDYDQYNLLAKVHQYVEGGHRFGLVGEIFSREDDIETRTTQTAAGAYREGNHFSGEEVERRRVALTYDYAAPETGGWFDEGSAVLYYQTIERHSTVDAIRSTSPTGEFRRDNSLEEETFGFNGDLSRSFQIGETLHRLTLGTELRTATTTQYSAGVDGCPDVTPYPAAFRACANLHTNQADTPEVEGSAIGLFAQNEIGFQGGRLRVTPGLRFDWYEEKPGLTPEYEQSAAYDGTLPPSSSDTAVSPKLLVEYDLLPELTAYAQWGMGFRAPTVGELYSRFGAVGTYLRTGNPELEAEISNGFDIGLKLGTDDLGAHINIFRTEYENFIDVVQVAPPGGEYPQGGISSYYNIPDARISGVELGAHVRFLDYWRARGSLAYAEGRNLTDDTYLDSVSPLTAILGLGYDRQEWGGEVSTKLAARRDRVDNGFVAPGYGVVDVTAWYEPARLPGLKLAGGIFNVLDKTYYDAVNVPDSRAQPDLYYSEPGRSFKLNVSYRF